MKIMFNFRALLTLAVMLALPLASHANTYTKADNTNRLDQAVSWGGTAPTATDVANWSGTYSASTVTNSLATALPGSALSWQGITVGTVSGTALTTNTIVARTTNITAAAEAVVNGFNVVTITTAANHGFEPGQSATIAGVTPSGYNGTYIVAGVPAATQFTYTNATGSLSAGTAFGTVQSAIYIGGSGTATANSKLTIGSSGIDLTSANVSVVINDNTNVFNGSQQWKVPAGRVLRFSNGGVTAASTRADTSGSDGTIEISGGGVVSLNPGGSTGFTDANSFAPFTGSWQVDSGTTLRSVRNGATALGTGSITLNNGTLSAGGINGDQGNWTWNSTINLNSATTSYISEQLPTGTGRSLLLTGSINGSGNLIFIEPMVSATTFTSQDAGFVLSGSDSMSGTVTIGGPVENGVPGRLTFLRVGGNATGTAVTLGAGSLGSLGSATSVINNGVLSFTRVDGYSLPCAVTGTGTLRIGSQNTATGTSGFVGDAYQVITLTGANTYSGQTIINAGTLTLGAGATLPNTSLIAITTNTVNGGAVINTFDVSALAGYTVGAGQVLSLNGGLVNGNLTLGTGSTNYIAPGCSNLVGNLNITGNLNLSGGTNIFVLDINNTPANDTVTVGGTLTASGVTTLQFVPPGSGLNAGTYTLFTAANPVSATSANFSIAGLTAGPRPQTFSIAVSGNTVQLVVVGSPGNLTWVGDGTANVWNTGTTSNWFNNLTSLKDVFYANDIVTFDDTGSNTPAINLTGTLLPSAVNVTATKNYTFGGSGQMGGAGTLTVSGSGTLSINNSNSFTGGVTLTAGVLAITNEFALGNPTNAAPANVTLNGGALMVTNSLTLGANTNRGITLGGSGGTLNVSNAATTLTVASIVAGTGNALTKTGNGTLVLSNANTHSLTVVNGGSVICGSGKATGTGSSWAAGATIQSGFLDINGQSNYKPSDGVSNYLFFTAVTFGQVNAATTELKDTTASHAGFIIYNGTSPYAGIVYDGANDPGKATISAPWYGTGTSFATTRQVQVGTSANAPVGLEFTGTISQRTSIDGQNTTLEKTGDGVLKISNTNYFPGLKISGGKLIAGHVNALGSVRAIANTVTVTGSGSTLDLNGFSPTISDLEDGGTSDGTVLNNGGSASTLTVTHGTVVSSFSGTLANGSSTLALTKAGANTVTLSGADTYTGATIVSNGTLVVSGSLSAGSAVTVFSNATFRVDGGTVNRPVAINNAGTLSVNNNAVVNSTVIISDGGNVSVPGAGTVTNLTFANTGAMNFNVANGGILTVAGTDGVTNNGAVNSVTLNITGVAPAPGTYVLIAYSGSLKGSGYNAFKLGTTPGGASYTLVNNPGVAVELTVTPALFWSGAQSSEWSTNAIGGLMNWTLLGNPTDYTNGAVVVFDDSLTGSTTVDSSVANITPANVYFNNSANTYTLQGSAAIAGATSLGKNGSGTLTIANNNSYSGGTTINAGAVQVGTNGTSGSLGSGAISVVTDLQFNRADARTVTNNISGVGTVEQNGSGTLTLSGTNTYSGVTTVNAGTLIVTNGNAIGDSGTVSVASGATFQVNSSETIGGFTTVAGSTINGQTGTLTYSSGSILGNLTGAGGLTWKGAADTASGQFTTADALAFNGTLTLRGGTPSTSPGNMEGTAGRFWLHSTGGSQLPGTAFALDTGASATNGQDFIIGDWDATSGNRSLNLSSLTGYGTIRTDAGATGTRNLVVNQSSGDTTFNGMILSHAGTGGQIRGLALVKTGSSSLTLANVVGYETLLSGGNAPLTVNVLNGTLVMNATNTYTDPTTVSNGLLLVNGVIASDVTVTGGSLGGTGLIQSSVTVQNGGTLFTSPTGLGTLTISNTLTFQSGSTNLIKIIATNSTSDLVQGFVSATYAGSLVVSNLTGALTNGQSFQIFSSGGTGNFASITPAPGGGLLWSFNPTNGVLSAVSSIVISTNAELTSLLLTPGTLTPAFTSNVTSYATTNYLPNNPVTVTAISADTNATLQLSFNGGAYGPLTSSVTSGSMTLLQGITNVVQVLVTAQDPTKTNLYTVNVTLQPNQTTAPKLTNNVSGGSLNLNWGAEYLGYRLQVQTNNLSKGVSKLTNDWDTVAGSSATNGANITILTTNLNEYYRLVYP